jgi:hypothetical protein
LFASVLQVAAADFRKVLENAAESQLTVLCVWELVEAGMKNS